MLGGDQRDPGIVANNMKTTEAAAISQPINATVLRLDQNHGSTKRSKAMVMIRVQRHTLTRGSGIDGHRKAANNPHQLRASKISTMIKNHRRTRYSSRRFSGFIQGRNVASACDCNKGYA